MEEVKKAVEVEIPKTAKRYILLGRYDKSDYWYCAGVVASSVEELLKETTSYTNYIETKVFEVELPRTTREQQ